MTHNKQATGSSGEDIATDYLRKQGFTIVTHNFRTKVGEIDIIARRGDKLHFVEVKARTSDIKGKPYEAVNRRKVEHLKKAAHIYLLQNKNKGLILSIDVISVRLDLGTLDYFEGVEI